VSTLHIEDAPNGRWRELTLHHGKANEIGTQQLDELEALIASMQRSDTLAALITRSTQRTRAGTPVFVAGANVLERVGWTEDAVIAHVARQRGILRRLAEAPVFHIAIVDGVAYGWGAEYTLTADYVLVSPGARFALPETGLGILPGAGGTTELQRRIGPGHTARLAMTGETIDADEAVRIGLAHACCPSPEAALAEARRLAAAAATRSPTANTTFKAALLASQGLNRSEAAAVEAAAYAHTVRSGEAAIGRARFAAASDDLKPAWGPRRSP
jgi:enoyl-CoA hydratase/carnithine racemase